MEKLIKKMLIEDPFYGFMLTTLERRWVNKGRISVHYTPSLNAELLVNRDWFEQFDEETRINLIKHELLHIAFKHIILYDSFSNKKRFNRAADLEVNCYLGKLPPDGCFCKDFGFPEKKGTMWYYQKLTELAENDCQQTQQQRQQQPSVQPAKQEVSLTDMLRSGNKAAKAMLYRKTLPKAVINARRYTKDNAMVKTWLREAYSRAFDDVITLQLDDYGFNNRLPNIIDDVCALHMTNDGLEFPGVELTQTAQVDMTGVPATVIAKALCSLPTGYRMVFNQLTFRHSSDIDLAVMLNMDKDKIPELYERAKQLFIQAIIDYKNEELD